MSAHASHARAKRATEPQARGRQRLDPLGIMPWAAPPRATQSRPRRKQRVRFGRRECGVHLRSGGAMILTFIEAGASAVISLDMRSAMPEYMVVPPERTTLAYRSLRMSTSHFMMLLYVVSCTPGDSMPRKVGWKRASGQRKRSLPMVMTWPSGSSYDFSSADDCVAVCISWSKSSATYASFSLMSRTISRSAVVMKEAEDGVRERVALVDRDSVRDTVARVHHNAG